MGNALEVVALSVGEVVHGVGIPFVTRTDMGDVQHTVDQRIAEQHVRMGHVDLGTQHEGARLTLAAVHILEEFEVLLDGTVAIGTVRTRTGGRTFLPGDHLCTLFIDIGTSLLDEPYGEVPELLEIVTGIIDVGPLEPKPLDIVLDALNIFCIFLNGIRIVETEVTGAVVFLG